VAGYEIFKDQIAMGISDFFKSLQNGSFFVYRPFSEITFSSYLLSICCPLVLFLCVPLCTLNIPLSS
jgi:hypothetical protein